MLKVKNSKVLVLCCAVLCLSACSSTQWHQAAAGSVPQGKLINPLIMESLLLSDEGQTIQIQDAPWQGQRATKVKQYFAASGRQCMQVRLEHRQQLRMSLLCELPNQHWVESRLFES